MRTFTVSLPAEACSLRALRALVSCVLEEARCPDREQVLLAVDEACANLVKHRCRALGTGRLELAIEHEPGLLRFRVARFCRPDQVELVRPRAPGDRRPGGRGTAFIAKIMDRVAFEPEPGGQSVALVLEKRSGP